MLSSRFVCLIVSLVCHTWQAYSMTERMIVVHILMRCCCSIPAGLSRMMKYSRCEFFLVISPIWSCHIRSCEMVTPSSRVLWTCSIWMSLIVIGGMSGVFLLKQMRPLCYSVSRCLEWTVNTRRYDSKIVQSSTYLMWSQVVRKSFIWCTKPIGPKIVPCGLRWW